MKPEFTILKGNINVRSIRSESPDTLWGHVGNPCIIGYMLLLIATMSYSQTASGTSIVVGWSDSIIVIGADSRLTSSDDSTFSALTCKIIVINDSIVFVHSGIFTDPSGLDMQSAIRFYLSANGTLDDRLAKFRDSVVAKLTPIFVRRKKERPDNFKRFKPLDAASCIVVAVSKDSLRMRRIDFSGIILPDIPEGFWISGNIYDPIRIDGHVQTEPFLMPLGHTEMTFAFSDSFHARNIIMLPQDFPRIVFSLISLETVLHPRDIGDPIDIIRITRGKHPEWIHQQKEPCQ